jgi:hypothetical protein
MYTLHMETKQVSMKPGGVGFVTVEGNSEALAAIQIG